VSTHADLDHSGGLPAVVRSLHVRLVWATDVHPDLAAAAAERGVPIVPPLGALHPWPGDPTEGNDASTVLGVGPLLLLGDAETAAEARVAARLPGRFPIVKIAHHGSRTSTTEVLLHAARPVLAIVSVGPDNRFGHPHPDVLRRLAEHGVVVVRTDRDGTVVVDVEDGVIGVRADRSHTTLEVRCRPACGSVGEGQ
jgi:competence protein ComEC